MWRTPFKFFQCVLVLSMVCELQSNIFGKLYNVTVARKFMAFQSAIKIGFSLLEVISLPKERVYDA